jgi:hypothetical protein
LSHSASNLSYQYIEIYFILCGGGPGVHSMDSSLNSLESQGFISKFINMVATNIFVYVHIRMYLCLCKHL